MSINLELLEEVCRVPGAPGFEARVAELVKREITDLVDEVKVDPMGNVLGVLKGRSSDKKTMAAAAQRVIIHGKEDVLGVMGCKPIHIMTEEEKSAKLLCKHFFIDTGMSKEKLEGLIEVGSSITRERELVELGDCVSSKSLDNRASVFILIEALRKFKESGEVPAYDFYAAFTVQEEVGLPEQDKITRLGEGAGIKIMDGSAICDVRMVRYMKKVAEAGKIHWQPEILPAGGTDTAGLQMMTPGGCITGAISVPTRYIHQAVEMSHKGDLENCIDLLVACVSKLDMDGVEW